MRNLFSSFGVKFAFVLMYIVSNIWAAFDIIDKDSLIGDHAGWPAPSVSEILIALGFVISVYIGILFLVKEKKNCKVRCPAVIQSKTLSLTIFAIQAIFFAFVVIFSAGAAGGDMDKAGGGLRFLFYLINPDLLFIIFYAATMLVPGNVKYRKANLVLFFVSNLVRGWIGQTLVIVFLLAINWVKTSGQDISGKKLVSLTFFGFIFFVLASFLMHIKIALRLGGDAIVEILGSLSVYDVMSTFFETLFSRLQLLSTVSFQITKKGELSRFIDEGIIGNFYTDGLPQQTIYKILGIDPGENLNLFLWKYYIPGDFFEAQTTVQPGFVGWLYLLSMPSIIIFLCYMATLIYINLRLIKKIGGNGLRYLSWFSIMLYLVPGWLGAYISFLWSLMVFLMMVSFIHDRQVVSAIVRKVQVDAG